MVEQIACQVENPIAFRTGSPVRVLSTEDARTVSFARMNNGTSEVRRTSIAAGSDHRWLTADLCRLDPRTHARGIWAVVMSGVVAECPPGHRVTRSDHSSRISILRRAISSDESVQGSLTGSA